MAISWSTSDLDSMSALKDITPDTENGETRGDERREMFHILILEHPKCV